ncbi:MAG: hypothetical protein ABI782_12655 [Anaerolineaceae bacterium]
MTATTAVRFPSVAWFEALNALCNDQDLFRVKRDGACDALVGIKVGDSVFELRFEMFRVASARAISVEDLHNVDFWLEQTPEAWEAMLKSTRELGRAEGNYTLNSLDLMAEDDFARSHDAERRDAFYRFNQTFQDYFDASAALDTVFA